MTQLDNIPVKETIGTTTRQSNSTPRPTSSVSEETLNNFNKEKLRIRRTQIKPKISELTIPVAAGITTLVGKITGEIKVRVLNEVEGLLKETQQSCGNVEKLEKVSKKLDKIKRFNTGAKIKVGKLAQVVDPLQKVVIGLNAAILILLVLPTPGALTTAGVNAKYADILGDLKELRKRITDDIAVITAVILGTGGALGILSSLENSINIIDLNIKRCLEQTGNSIPLENFQPPSPPLPTQYTSADGRTYSIKVILVDTAQIAPLRQAIASDTQGIIRYKSDKSFSSSEKVLIDEVKFRIDNNIIT